MKLAIVGKIVAKNSFGTAMLRLDWDREPGWARRCCTKVDGAESASLLTNRRLTIDCGATIESSATESQCRDTDSSRAASSATVACVAVHFPNRLHSTIVETKHLSRSPRKWPKSESVGPIRWSTIQVLRCCSCPDATPTRWRASCEHWPVRSHVTDRVETSESKQLQQLRSNRSSQWSACWAASTVDCVSSDCWSLGQWWKMRQQWFDRDRTPETHYLVRVEKMSVTGSASNCISTAACLEQIDLSTIRREWTPKWLWNWCLKLGDRTLRKCRVGPADGADEKAEEDIRRFDSRQLFRVEPC
jgi:hypothetical protein